MSHFGQVHNTNIKQNKRLDIYYSKGPHIIFGKVVAGQPHAGLSLSAPYRHQRVTRWHTDRSVHPDVTPFSVYTAPRSSDPRFRPYRTLSQYTRPHGGPTAAPSSETC